MELDPSNVTFNSTFKDTYEKYIPNAWDLLVQISVILGIATDAFLIYIITVFKTLQTKRNILILNWIISDLICLVFHSTNLETIAWLVHGGYAPHVYYCMFYNMENLFQNIEMIFINILFIERFYENMTLRTIPFIWIINLIFVLSAFTECLLRHDSHMLHIILLVNMACFLFSFLFKSCLYLYRWIRRVEQKPEVRNILTATYLSCWVLGFIFSIYVDFGRRHILNAHYVVAIINMLSSCTSILITLVLASFDNEFRYFIKKTLMCKRGLAFNDISFNKSDVESRNYQLFESDDVETSINK